MRSSFAVVLSAVAITALPRAALAADDVEVCANSADDGQRERAAGKLRDAETRFLACAAEVCPVAVRLDCSRWATETSLAVPTVVIDARDGHGQDIADVTTRVDGEVLSTTVDGRAIRIDPGPHTFRFDRPGEESITQQLIVKEGAKNRPITVVFGHVDPIAPPTPSVTTAEKSSTGPILLAAVGAAVAITGAVMMIVAPKVPSNCDSSTQTCIRGSNESDADFQTNQDDAGRAQGLTTAGVVSLVGGLAIATGGFVWLALDHSSSSSSDSKPRAAIVPWLGQGSGGLTASGRF